MGEMCSSAEFEKRMVTRYKGDTHHYCLALDSKTVIDAQRAGSECRYSSNLCTAREGHTFGGLFQLL